MKRHRDNYVVKEDHVNDNWKKERDDAVAQLAAKRNSDQLQAIRPGHAKYLQALERSTITIVSAPAGVGKTYMACGIAARMLKSGRIDRIIITRPLIQCNGRNSKRETLGILPGSIDEKVGPYMRPIFEAFADFFSAYDLSKLVHDKKIEIIPLELMRGSSLKRTFIMCDEAQNAVLDQLQMLLTRLDTDARIVLMGDATQSDLPDGEPNALVEVIRRFSNNCHKEISIVKMTKEDICRPPLVRWIIERFEDSPNQEKWYSATCPNQKCKCKLWYDDTNEKSDFIKCYKCKSSISLYNDNGEFHAVVGKFDNEILVETFPIKPY